MEKILDKIKKLQALAGNNPSEAEATAAAEKVQELLREYNLSMADLDDHEIGSQETIGKTEYVIPNANRLTTPWKSILLHHLCKHNFCASVRQPGTSRVALIGKPSNVAAVCYLHEILVSQIERLSKEAAKSVFEHKTIYTREFCLGAARRIAERLREEKEAAEKASEKCTALMVTTGRDIRAAVSLYFPRTRANHYGSGNRTNGFSDGQTAGNTIGIPRGGIDSARTRSLL